MGVPSLDQNDLAVDGNVKLNQPTYFFGVDFTLTSAHFKMTSRGILTSARIWGQIWPAADRSTSRASPSPPPDSPRVRCAPRGSARGPLCRLRCSRRFLYGLSVQVRFSFSLTISTCLLTGVSLSLISHNSVHFWTWWCLPTRYLCEMIEVSQYSVSFMRVYIRVFITRRWHRHPSQRREIRK